MPADDILLDCEEQMEKALDHLKHELRAVRTGRASPALVEHIHVDYYGTPTPLKSIATISVPEATQLLIKPFSPGDAKAIEKAIGDSKSSVSRPTQRRQALLALMLPSMSQERRLQMVGQCKQFAEAAKVSVRNARRDANKLVETEHKGSVLTEDQAADVKTQIQDLIKQYETKIEELVEHKKQEVMQI